MSGNCHDLAIIFRRCDCIDIFILWVFKFNLLEQNESAMPHSIDVERGVDCKGK